MPAVGFTVIDVAREFADFEFDFRTIHILDRDPKEFIPHEALLIVQPAA
jgi:hypothetical protein